MNKKQINSMLDKMETMAGVSIKGGGSEMQMGEHALSHGQQSNLNKGLKSYLISNVKSRPLKPGESISEAKRSKI